MGDSGLLRVLLKFYTHNVIHFKDWLLTLYNKGIMHTHTTINVYTHMHTHTCTLQ
jgi:hypothetical protein